MKFLCSRGFRALAAAMLVTVSAFHSTARSKVVHRSSLQMKQVITAKGTFHRRDLKHPSVSFSSPEGRALFQQAMSEGNLESYYPLAENFLTQGNPAFCGIASLTMALNALLIDPGKVWQGVWRWFDESMLDCCQTLDSIKEKGVTMPTVACLAKCNGAEVTMKFASDLSEEEFKNDLLSCCSLSKSGLYEDDLSHIKHRPIMVASYSRKILNQTGSGHFSPIAAYSVKDEMVLIMDVARFKYPPHWVPIKTLFEAMRSVDPETDKSRGYLLLKASQQMKESFCGIGFEDVSAGSCCSSQQTEHTISVP